MDKLLPGQSHRDQRELGSPASSSSSSFIKQQTLGNAPLAQAHHAPHQHLQQQHPHALQTEYPLHRGSISTELTSDSGDRSYLTRPSVERRSSSAQMMVDDDELVARPPPRPRRNNGSYKLSDFYFHRTLGTGSFGRVHLGV